MEFSWYKISIMRHVFVEIFGLFWLTPKTPEWPKNDTKKSKNFPILCNVDKFPGFINKMAVDK